MTARWEKGEQHLVLIIEGQSSNPKGLKSALDINIDGNILIDMTAVSAIDQESFSYLDQFAEKHKAKRFSIIIASKIKCDSLKHIEVIPTLSEARDIIFMEITERELGFFDDEISE